MKVNSVSVLKIFVIYHFVDSTIAFENGEISKVLCRLSVSIEYFLLLLDVQDLFLEKFVLYFQFFYGLGY